MKSYSLSVLFMLCLFSCKTEPTIEYELQIGNVFLIDMETGQLDTVDIYIDKGKIVHVAKTGEKVTPKVSMHIDATGKYALPGFWDNHVHFRGGDSLIADNKKFLNLFLANGITTVRDAGGDLTVNVIDWKAQIKEGTLDGPTIFTSGPKIDGANATWAGSLEVENEGDIENALDSLQKIPVDFVKLYDSKISGPNYIKTIEAAEKRGMITSGHMPFTVTLNETIDAGIDAVEHLYYIMKGASADEITITEKLKNQEIGFWDAMPLLQNSYADSTAVKTFEKLKANSVFVVPTLHIGKTLSYLDEVDHATDPYLKYMSPGIRKTYQGRIDRVKNASEKSVKDRKELDRFFGRLTYALHQAGVSLLAGSDSGAYNSYTYPGISLHRELEALVAAGISPLDALRTSAYNGSKFLKKQDGYGTIAKGKFADIVLLNTNPLTDIKNTKDLFLLVKEGSVYSQQELKRLMD